MLRVLLLSLLLVSASSHCRSEEIPLEQCDTLPVLHVTIGNSKYLFLVDTAATSMLNIQTFGTGENRAVAVTSWSGTVQTKAREVTIPELVIGEHHMKDLHLPAVDLSAIGRACGKRIDGILGIDLLGQLHAVVQLKGRGGWLHLERDDARQAAELHQQLVLCAAAFNRADEAAFSDCLDPEIVLFSMAGDFYGRDAALDYYRARYFRQTPPAQLLITPRAHHPLGDAMWVEYDLQITIHDEVITARGTALCRKAGGRWRIVHMNHSNPQPEAVADRGSPARDKQQ